MRKVEVYRHGLPAILLLLLASLLASLVAVLVPVTTPATADSEPRYGKARWAYYVPYAANSFASLQQHIGDLDYLSPYWYQVDERGNILPLGGDAGDTHKLEIMRLAQDHGVKLVPMVKNRATYEDFHPVWPTEMSAATQSTNLSVWLKPMATMACISTTKRSALKTAPI